jgi:hypothetical protein
MEFLHWACFEKKAVASDCRVAFYVLALWITPILLFDLLMYVALPGHVLNFFPAVVILASIGLVKFSKQLPVTRALGLGVVFATITAINVVVFLYASPLVMRMSMGLKMSGREIRKHDANLLECFRAIRQG